MSEGLTRPAGITSSNSATEWLDLRQLKQYAAVPERTLRSWIHKSADPLPAYQVGTKILVRKRDFDSYVERHPLRQAGTLENVINEILADVILD